MKLKSKIKLGLATGLVLGIALCGVAGVRVSVQPTAAHADTPFDHSNCQYPDRTTNPADGCDNSDPCDPAQTKGGSGDCLPVTTGPGGDKDPTPPDPDRPYYDQYGNKYDYMGNLIQAAPVEAAPAKSSCSQ